MFCSKCGKPLEGSAKFCPYCGQPAAAQIPTQQYTQYAPPPAPKKSRKTLWIVLAAIAALSLGTVFVREALLPLLGGIGSNAPDQAEKSESLFAGLVDYEFRDFLFRTPDDIYWEDEYLGDGEMILDAEDFSVFALAYNAKALKNLDIQSEEDLIEFAAQRWGAGDDYDVESFSSGHYIVVDGQAVIGVYMQDKQGWLIAVEVHNSNLFYDYYSLAEFIATSGIITSE